MTLGFFMFTHLSLSCRIPILFLNNNVLKEVIHMVRIGNNLNMGRAFFSSDGESINGGVTVEDLQNIAKTIARDYKNHQINVKNIFDVMKQVFTALDEKSSTLEETRRKDIAIGIIHHILNLNRNTEVQAFADHALDLLIEYSIDSIAVETLKPAEQVNAEDPEMSLNLDSLKDEQLSLISEQLQHEDTVSRSRFEGAKTPLTEDVASALEFNDELESAASIKEDVELALATNDEPIDEITVPSKAASIALSKAATQNSTVIENQVEEVAQYIRSTSIEVDDKISQAQDKIHDCIDCAFGRVGVVCDKLVDILEGAHELSADTKGKIVNAVNEFAEKLIDAVVKAKSDLILEKDNSEKGSSLALPLSEASVELPIQEIIANQ